MRLAPLRPFDRVIAGYATLAFAFAAGEGLVLRRWSVTLLGAALSAAGTALLVHDHHRWRAARRTAGASSTTKAS